ncbi:PAS domain S-box-containing protein [Symbiobacterium terraclitae]|uniref:Stage 0 sporulation protein A homolog n=1 Tax=Symbiobacterium terraclitae TaxID=557451 RepID=A0ABS4JRX9_9FIRM|nr:response regulator [Symbiobacterium terraclitae]MBP2018293.1 PAS domain S-box-containing protein [Symbiobacterium terraclitae]
MDVTKILQEVYWHSLDGIVIADKDTYIIDVNPAYELITGYSRSELIGRKTNIVRSGLTPPEVYREMWSQLRTRGRWVGEFINRHKNGNLWYSFVSITRIVDEGGSVVAYVGIARDISARKQMEQQLRQNLKEIQSARELADAQATRLRALLDSVGEAIIMFDTQGICVVANHQAGDMLGLAAEEIVGRSVHELHSLTLRSLGASGAFLWNPGPDGGPPIELETTVIETREERPRVFHEFAAPVQDDAGRVIGRIYVYRDITKETELDRMKTEFIATVSHELRTPMTSIKGSLGLVLGGAAGDIPAEARDLLTIARNNTDRLIRLINDILDISRLEAGKMEIRPAPVRVDEAVRRAVQEMAGFARQRAIELKTDVPEGLPRVMADSDRLQQVLDNLLSNAVKFSPKGSEVLVRARAEEGVVRFDVIDHGPGIPPEQTTAIFDRFYQVDNAASRKTGGTGLGLAICRGIVEEHGGRIWVESTVGKGSTFSFTLPVEPPEPEIPLPLNVNARTVLVVDDDPDIVRLIMLSLEQEGIQAVGATSGAQALEIARSRHIDAITLDLMMPGEDGVSVIHRLKEDPATRDIPVVVVSAYTGGKERELKATGVADVVAKPIDEARLLSSIRGVLGDRRDGSPQPSILVVDDDPDVRRIVSVILERSGYSVRTAHDGQEAFRMIMAERPDLLILDLMMPNLDGFQLVRLLRQRRWTQQIPLLVLTALDLTEGEKTLLQLGPTSHLTKGPQIQEEVVARVRALLAKR